MVGAPVGTTLGYQIPQPVSSLPLAQTEERTIAQLTDALTGDSHHPANLLERTTVAIVQAKVQPQDLGVAGRQGGQGSLNIPRLAVGHGGHIGAFLLAAGEPLDPFVALPIPGGVIQADRFRVKCTQL